MERYPHAFGWSRFKLQSNILSDTSKYISEIKFTLDKPLSIKLRIFNQIGRVVDIRHFYKLPAGEHCIPCPITDFTDGEVFSYQIEKEGEPDDGDVVVNDGTFIARN
jgi:hypothetical protein